MELKGGRRGRTGRIQAGDIKAGGRTGRREGGGGA